MAANADPMTKKMSEASAKPEDRGGAGTPKKGDRFRCERCGMEVQVTQDCHCSGSEHAEFNCCGQALRKV
ncbi:MAG TPA: hypothetical protein VEL76_33615 [Gemmataceae bacterium]|nr:hypothetical protein [Gemmataceae bacterium]